MSESTNNSKNSPEDDTIKNTEIFDKLFNPELIDSLFYPYQDTTSLKVYLVRNNEIQDEPIELNNIYPFFTVDNLKEEIYAKKDKNERYAPKFQFLAIPFDEENNEITDNTTLGANYEALDYTFTKRGSSNILRVTNPSDAFTNNRYYDERITDKAGNKSKDLQMNPRNRSTVEDVLLKTHNGKYPILHLFTYSNLKSQAEDLDDELTEKELNTRVFPYFPYITSKQTLTSEEIKSLKQSVESHLEFKTLETNLQKTIEEFSFSSEPEIREANYLQFLWLERTKEKQKTLDTIFYEMSVNDRRPYLRFYPSDNTPISKIHVKGALPIPDLPDPCYLLQWAKEKSPLSKNDYIYSKIKIDSIDEQKTPIYGTLQIVEDGSARFIIEPPKKMDKLSPTSDLQFLKQNLLEGIKGLPFENTRIDIDESNLVALLPRPRNVILNKKDIQERLKGQFKPFFQEITLPIQEKPLFFLRYRQVSNFSIEDAINIYFTILFGVDIPEILEDKLIESIRKQFNLKNDQEVITKFNEWKIKSSEIAVISTEKSIFKRKNNQGIDIAIYLQDNNYIFKIFRIDSYLNLQRILTLLTLMFTANKSDFETVESSDENNSSEESSMEGGADSSSDSDESSSEKPKPKPTAVVKKAVLPTSSNSSDSESSSEKPKPKSTAVVKKPVLPSSSNSSDSESSSEKPKPKATAVVKNAVLSSSSSSSDSESSSEKPKPKATAVVKNAVLSSSSNSSDSDSDSDSEKVEVVGKAEEKIEQTFSANLKEYLLERLYKTDRTLFKWETSQRETSYVMACQKNDGKQPIGLDSAGYTKMINEYSKDIVANKMYIITYNYETGFEGRNKEKILSKPKKGEKRDPNIDDNTFILLKYGTNYSNLNYYFCPEYFCIRDNILIRKEDLNGKSFRNSPLTRSELKGKTKEPGRCPFCNGKVIQNPEKREKDEFVYHRIPIGKNKKADIKTFINFYSKPIHPSGWILPCCGKTVTHFDLRDKSKKGLLMAAAAKKMEKAKEAVQIALGEKPVEKSKEIVTKVDVREKSTAPNYQDTLQRLPQQYIIKEDAEFLDVTIDKPQIGLLPSVASEYFAQNNKTLLEKETTLTQVREDSEGFLRVGVMNIPGKREESFFSAIAPFLLLNSADEVRDLIKTKITARDFISANYGNLMMEFYSPNFPNREITSNELRVFSTNYLGPSGIINTPEQKPYVTRIYRSYLHFMGDKKLIQKEDYQEDKDTAVLSFIDDPKQIKEYRQFASLLAQPGLFTNRGIVFIVLEINADNKIDVLCPPYGFNSSMNNCDIGFLLKKRNIWEPILYYKTKSKLPGQLKPSHNVTLRFQRALKSSKDQPWPEIVSRRVEEFQNKCAGPDSAQYTGIMKIKENAKLMSLSQAVKLFVGEYQVFGIIRDTYNHIVAALFKSDREISTKADAEPTVQPLIAVPVKDDGIIRKELQVYLNWDGYQPASAEDVINFYENKENIKFLQMFPGYKPEYLIRVKNIEALQLENGIFVPVKKQSKSIDKLEEIQVNELEWTINKNIMFESFLYKKDPILQKIDTDKQLEEAYEHFRLSFSNWFTGAEKESNKQLREEIETIINPTTKLYGFELPVYEKRKRLEIILSPIILQWITTTENGPGNMTSLLRLDCINMNKQNECKGSCIWKTGESNSGKCLIHAPQIKKDDADKTNIDVPLLFMYKIIDELIRYPLRRDQLLRKSKRYVSHLISIDKPIRFGNTYIIPENSIEWTDLMRMDCKLKMSEKPLFFEEMSDISRLNTKKDDSHLTKISQNVIDFIFGKDDDEEESSNVPESESSKYRIYTWDREQVPYGMDVQKILSHFKLSFAELGIKKEEDKLTMDTWTPEIWKNLISIVQKGFIYIDIPDQQIKGRQYAEPDNYILVKQINKSGNISIRFMIYKNNIEISSIKTRLLPEHLQNQIIKLTKLQPKV